MSPEERERFNEANKVVHPVETQWHYPIMTAAGFTPITKSGVGFVRAYEYEHPRGFKIRVSTGVSCDHWKDTLTSDAGYWRELEPYLKKLTS